MAMMVISYPDRRRMALEPSMIMCMSEITGPDPMDDNKISPTFIPLLEIFLISGGGFCIIDKERELFDFIMGQKTKDDYGNPEDRIIQLR